MSLSPARVREVLKAQEYETRSAAKELGVSRDVLVQYTNSKAYVDYVKAEAHIEALKIYDLSARETKRNIEVLCEIRDSALSKNPEKTAAIKALKEILSEYQFSSWVQPSETKNIVDAQREAVERLRKAMENAGAPPERLQLQ